MIKIVALGLGVIATVVVANILAYMTTFYVLSTFGLDPGGASMLSFAALSFLLIGVTVVLALLVRRFIFREALPCLLCSEMGLSLKSFGIWVAFSFGLIAFCWGALFVLGQGTFSLGESSVVSAFVAALLLSLAPGVSEEIFFRYMLYGGLKHYWGKLPAALICGVLFGVAHLNQVDNIVDGAVLILAAMSVTLLFISIYEVSGSIWAPAIVHTVWDMFFLDVGFIVNSTFHVKEGARFVFAQLDLASTNKWITGGSFGVEQGGIAIVAYLVLAFVFFRMSASKA